MNLSYTYVITGLNANIFSITRAVQKGFPVTSEGKALILQNPTDNRFDKKMAINVGKGFIPAKNLYKSAKDAVILAPEK